MLELPALYNTIIGGLIVAVITGISGLVWSLFRKRNAIRKWKEEEEVKGIIELGAERFKLVKSSTFIPTMGQIEGPHDSDNITRSNRSFDLVDKLLKDIFSPDEGTWKRRFAILGGTGMGKSTFSAYLFYKYINYYKYKECKYPIYIKYLGQKDVLSDLRNMSEKNDVSQSILILDALDENRNATNDTKAFLDEIEEITDKYRIVILTSRTQFFPNKESEPTKGNILQNSRSNRFLLWEVIYISPFDEKETRRYLETKFKVPSKEYSKAIKIAALSNDLMMRPMILSYVNYLLDLADNKTIKVSEIYARIIDKWLSDECEGQALGKSDLYTFSKNLSFYIYEKWKQSGESYVTEEEFQNFLSQNDYHDIPYSFRGRSLVNRRGDGSIKFSHKSFWEFFMAVNSIENPFKSFEREGFDMAPIIAKEINQLYLTGTKLDHINYYHSSFFEHTNGAYSSKLFFILKKGQDALKKSNLLDEKTIIARCNLSEYWEVFVKKLSGELYSSVLVIKDSTGTYKKQIDEYICDIQNAFNKTSESDYMTIFFSHRIIREDFMIKSNMPIKEIIIFPDMDKDLTDELISNNNISIGKGFYNNDSIYLTIKRIANRIPNISVICVYIDGENICDIANFIHRLSSQYIDNPLRIIIKVKYDSKELLYVVNKNTKTSNIQNIESCLLNMAYAYESRRNSV